MDEEQVIEVQLTEEQGVQLFSDDWTALLINGIPIRGQWCLVQSFDPSVFTIRWEPFLET